MLLSCLYTNSPIHGLASLCLAGEGRVRVDAVWVGKQYANRPHTDGRSRPTNLSGFTVYRLNVGTALLNGEIHASIPPKGQAESSQQYD